MSFLTTVTPMLESLYNSTPSICFSTPHTRNLHLSNQAFCAKSQPFFLSFLFFFFFFTFIVSFGTPISSFFDFMELHRYICLIFLVSFLSFVSSSKAYKFDVGGKDGWVLKPSEDYNHWAGRNRFNVNDTLCKSFSNML